MSHFLGVFINVATVLVGSTVGLLLGRGLPERFQKAVMTALGLCTLAIGIQGVVQGQNALVMILSLVFGTAIGTLIDLDRLIGKIGEWVQKKYGKSTEGGPSVAEGFVTASLLFCIGAMTVVGCLNAGISSDNELLIAKAVMDMISSCMLGASLGIGVVLSSAFVLVFQGGLVLAFLLIGGSVDTVLLAELTCTGSVMILGLGMNIVGIAKIKVANMLPALALVPLFSWLLALLPF